YNTLHKRTAISQIKHARLLGRTLLKNLVIRGSWSATISSMPSVAGAPHAAPDLTTTVAGSYDHCHHLARASNSNFYYAFFLLPKPKRDGLAALYAFIRLIDDVSDEGQHLASK